MCTLGKQARCTCTFVLILFLSLSYFFTLLLVSLRANPTSSRSFSSATARSWRVWASTEYMLLFGSYFLIQHRTYTWVIWFWNYIFAKLDAPIWCASFRDVLQDGCQGFVFYRDFLTIWARILEFLEAMNTSQKVVALDARYNTRRPLSNQHRKLSLSYLKCRLLQYSIYVVHLFFQACCIFVVVTSFSRTMQSTLETPPSVRLTSSRGPWSSLTNMAPSKSKPIFWSLSRVCTCNDCILLLIYLYCQI